MTDDTQAIINIARDSTIPHPVEAGKIYIVQSSDGCDTVDLTGEEHRAIPKRKKGTAFADDVASFSQYYLKHEDGDHAEVFADADMATITAILNAHGTGDPGWQDHRVILKMRRTDQWKAWADPARDRKLMPQQQFAEFIEDHSGDIAPDGPVTAADLLEIAQSFHAHTKVTFNSGKRLSSGETAFEYTEDTTATAGKRGTIAIPGEFELALKPFEDCNLYRVKARFRYRLNDGALALGYHLDDPASIFRAAVGEVIEQTENACMITIMRGQPS